MPAATLDHLGHERMRHRDRRAQVDLKRPIDLLHRQGIELSAARQCCVGHENVQLTCL